MKTILAALLVFLVSVESTEGGGVEHGKVVVKSTGGMHCQEIELKTQFNSSIQVLLTLSHDNSSSDDPVHDPVSLWTYSVTLAGFSFCALEMGEATNGSFIVNWAAVYVDSQDLAHTRCGTVAYEAWESVIQCQQVKYASLTGVVKMYMTVRHTKERFRPDSMVAWSMGIGSKAASLCLRESSMFSGTHKGIYVDWCVTTNSPAFTGRKAFPNTKPPLEINNCAYCETILFTHPYYAPPTVIVTANNGSSSEGAPLIGWIESITKKDFKLCMKDAQLVEGAHYPAFVDYVALGVPDPCLNVQCQHFSTCKAFGPYEGKCVCDMVCPNYNDPVCSSGGRTFINECHMRLEICKNSSVEVHYYPGSCAGFPYLRGRVDLPMTSNLTETECTYISFRQNVFYPDKPIFVQASVNHFSTIDKSYVHDAAAVWVEQVTGKGCVACVTLTGRNERPFHRFATVDWLAYQGAPKDGVSGMIQIAQNWSTGTTCKTVAFPKDKFSDLPIVLVTAHHEEKELTRDAGSVWVEDVACDKFKVCFRELQNFDGIHEDINLYWIAFVDLHRPLFKEHGFVDFDTSSPPKDEDNAAYCEKVDLVRNYATLPTVLLTAHHKTGSGKIPPEHNGISVWAEYVTKGEFRVCVKELYVNKFDPLRVAYVVMEDVCSKDWFYFEGYCYLRSEQCKKWDDASSFCQGKNSHLTSVHNQEENVFIQLRHNGKESWIGLQDFGNGPNYNWSDNTVGNFSDWAYGRPVNTGSEYCGRALGFSKNWQWAEDNCSTCYDYMCKKDLDECAQDNTHCDQNANCTNVRGSYKCVCKSDYYGDGKTCVKNRGFDDSVILNKNTAFLRNLNRFLDPVSARGHRWKVCYRASVHGWSSYTFHSRCNKKGPTVSLIKSNYGGNVFGGYTDRSFASISQYRKSVKSFVFTLKNSAGVTPMKFNIYRYHRNAVYDTSSYGITFGGGHDIYISNNARTYSNSYANLGHTYSTPSGYSYGSTSTRNLLAGSQNFSPLDVEVFYIDRQPGGLERSNIIGNNATYLRCLNDWLYKATSRHLKWERCWWGKQDGFSTQYDYHSQCRGLGNLVTIVKSDKGYIFGGFSPLTLHSSGYSRDSSRKSFLFSLYNHLGRSPVQLPLYRYEQYSIYVSTSYGPIFGGGHDLVIYNSANQNTNSYSYLGHTYSPPSGMSYGSTDAKSFLAGSYNFKVSDIEVFYTTA